MLKVTSRLIAILGKRAFLSFGLVTFLVAGLLAGVNITSRHALKLYVEDQLRRTPWDLALYQTGGFSSSEDVPERIRAVDGVADVESLAFLRARFPEGAEVISEVDGKPLATPWLCMLTATDPALLPPQLGLALKSLNDAGNGAGQDNNAAMLALIGPERSIGRAFLSLQGAREFSVKVKVLKERRSLFNIPVRGVIRLDRDELNRWLMDQTGSVAFVPYIGLILLIPYQPEALDKFDTVATGLLPPDLVRPGETDYIHVALAEYVPEVVYLGRLDRQSIISGWDIGGSLERVAELYDRIAAAAQGRNSAAATTEPPRLILVHEAEEEEEAAKQLAFVTDSPTLVLLERMNRVSRLIGLVALLVALPLLWMAWVLAGNLSGLLILNERRKLGLMRLRGVPGRLMGRALILTVSAAGLLGGISGLAVGSLLPLMIYERGRLPAGVLSQREQLLLFVLFLGITLVLALVTSRRLIKYSTTISPLEASGRVAASEASRAALRFGPLELLALLLGSATLGSWIFGYSLSAATSSAIPIIVDRALNFIGLPLFLYGTATLLVSRRAWIQRSLAPIVKPIGGCLGGFAMRHIAVKPHRTLGFLFIVALMAGVSLYPTITSRSFEDKAVRGAQVQMGTELQLTFNTPDLVEVERLKGGLRGQLAALRPELERTMAALARVEGVQAATYLLETLLPSFYLPGYGLRGVPLYLIGDLDAYAREVYAEPELGMSGSFEELLARLRAGDVAVSPTVVDFWRLAPGTTVLLGMDEERRTISAPAAGTLAFLPGTPPRTVTDRQGYVQARVDYLNYLFSNNAYLAAAAGNARLADLQLLIPRVIVLVKSDGSVPLNRIQSGLLDALPHRPLEVHTLPQEIRKVGSDMFISLALENMRIYLIGGLFLALIAILAVALANYVEDRRTLALLRIRGASPAHIWRFLMAMLLSPALLGLALGGVAALAAGYGLTNYVWQLREIKTVVQLLPARLVISHLTLAITLALLALLVGAGSLFSLWVFRRTARENLQRE